MEEKTNYDLHFEELMQNPEFKKAYDDLGPVYELIKAIVGYRIDHGLSQKELAEKIGTKQSAISRFETSMKMPSMSFVQKIVKALDLELDFNIQPKGNKKTWEKRDEVYSYAAVSGSKDEL